MHMKTRVTLGVATVAAALGAALVPTTSAFAAPALTVTWPYGDQGYGAQNGQSVTAAGTGFKASSPVYVLECSDVKAASNCDISTASVGQTDANGAFSVNVTVHTGAVGDGTCNAGAGTTGTTSPPQCYIVASTDQTGQDLSQTAVGKLIFDRLQITPRSNLKNGQNVTVTGGGFAKSTTVYVSECTSADPAKATSACDFNSIRTFTTDANGAFAAGSYPVHTGTVGSDGVKCNPGGNCILAATDNVTNPGSGNIGGGVIQFAKVTATATSVSAPTHAKAGAKFAVKGKVTGGGAGVTGVNVSLFRNGAKVKTAKTGSGGAYSFTGLTQKKTSKYQVKAAAKGTFAASNSRVVTVKTP